MNKIKWSKFVISDGFKLFYFEIRVFGWCLAIFLPFQSWVPRWWGRSHSYWITLMENVFFTRQENVPQQSMLWFFNSTLNYSFSSTQLRAVYNGVIICKHMVAVQYCIHILEDFQHIFCNCSTFIKLHYRKWMYRHFTVHLYNILQYICITFM